jgi:hypothetical protein
MLNIAREFNVNLYYLVFGEGEMFIEPGKRTDMVILEELAGNSSHIRKFIYYFERSDIIRFFLLSQFKHKLMLDREMIDKEISEFEKTVKDEKMLSHFFPLPPAARGPHGMDNSGPF